MNDTFGSAVMPSKRSVNDTMPMVRLTPVALGGVPRRRRPSIPEPTKSMQARMQRALERIMSRLDLGRPSEADSR
ncbi:MAG: hypothetical protein AAF721_10515 [Myxococcota bacterium]